MTAGEGIMTVTAVGDRTYYGNMACEVQYDAGSSPLKEKLSGLAKTLSRFGYFCALTVAAVYLLNTFVLTPSADFSFYGILNELINAVSLAVSVVVEILLKLGKRCRAHRKKRSRKAQKKGQNKNHRCKCAFVDFFHVLCYNIDIK